MLRWGWDGNGFSELSLSPQILIVVISKVETAFRMFDTDQDGFLSWEEFQQVNSQVFTAYMYYVLI